MGKRILVVDDDQDFQFLLTKKLKANGFICDSAYTVEKALQKLKEDEPHLVILDLRFHNADGTAFLKNARQWLPEGRELPPVIVLSGYDEQEIIDYVLDLGAVDFIRKPFETETLLTKVRKCLGVGN